VRGFTFLSVVVSLVGGRQRCHRSAKLSQSGSFVASAIIRHASTSLLNSFRLVMAQTQLWQPLPEAERTVP